MRPISVRELDLAFSGNQCAYMLLYRSRILGQLPSAPRPSTAEAGVTASGLGAGASVSAGAGAGGGAVASGGKSAGLAPEVPAYWQAAVEELNETLVTEREEYVTLPLTHYAPTARYPPRTRHLPPRPCHPHCTLITHQSYSSVT